VKVKPPLNETDDWYQHKVTIKDGKYIVSLDGRVIGEEPLPKSHDPSLALLMSAAEGTAGVRNLKISGSPTIPEEIALSDRPQLNAWMAFYGESLTGKRAAWFQDNAEIRSRSRPDKIVDRQESLLQYMRPLVEDGELRYEFYYQPGKLMAHPALDRLTFLVDPKGIKIHWLTDAQYDRTGLGPGNVHEEPENRRGPDEIPLKANDWNEMKLVLAGNTVSLQVNGEQVYSRELAATNRRIFGLFHYADEGDVRVRNVVYRGDWPRALPRELQVAASKSESAKQTASLKTARP
jgi:hypothetical protein